jgi:citrate synthase
MQVSFEAPTALLRAAQRVARTARTLPAPDQLRMIVTAIRSYDPLRDDRRPVAVAATARGIIATIVDALPRTDGSEERSPARRASVAERLWPKLTSRPAHRDRVRGLDATLVLLADHELAASTLAARVAASTWADPYLVVETGLAAAGGPLHGGSSEAARRLLREVQQRGAAEVIGRYLRDGQRVPGFGHRVYTGRDPRADVLLGMVARASSPAVRAAEEVLETMQRRGLPAANVDFALATFAEAHHMIDGAGETIFAIARIAGWLAHAAEEYEHRLRFRPRAAYIGTRPE